jgi:hypothetical protein
MFNILLVETLFASPNIILLESIWFIWLIRTPETEPLVTAGWNPGYSKDLLHKRYAPKANSPNTIGSPNPRPKPSPKLTFEL